MHTHTFGTGGISAGCLQQVQPASQPSHREPSGLPPIAAQLPGLSAGTYSAQIAYLRTYQVCMYRRQILMYISIYLQRSGELPTAARRSHWTQSAGSRTLETDAVCFRPSVRINYSMHTTLGHPTIRCDPRGWVAPLPARTSYVTTYIRGNSVCLPTLCRYATQPPLAAVTYSSPI